MAYHKKRGSGSRDLGLSSNGKGSASRITDNKAYADNYSAIDWGHRTDTEREGWRELAPEERLRKGDKFWCAGFWVPTSFQGRLASNRQRYFRKL